MHCIINIKTSIKRSTLQIISRSQKISDTIHIQHFKYALHASKDNKLLGQRAVVKLKPPEGLLVKTNY